MLTPEVEIDSELRLKDITPSFFDILTQFEPFGPGNMSPVFVSRNCIADKNLTRTVGQDYRHLKISLRQDDSTQNFSGIGFQLGEYADALRSGKRFDVCYHIEENHFNGNSTLQLNIKDIKLFE